VIYSEIVRRINVEVFGSDAPQPEITTNLYGSEGIIGRIHRKIQEDWDYWFMQAQQTETLVNAQVAYDIDYEFKREIDLRIIDQAGCWYDQLTKVSPEQADTVQTSSGEPTHYWLDQSTYRRINLYPTPSITGTDTRTLHMRYWKYLDRLSDTVATFDAFTDVISVEAPYLLIYKSAADICITIENYEKMQIMEQRAQAELEMLKSKDWQYKSANMKLQYQDL
jgi:hypothetical protein